MQGDSQMEARHILIKYSGSRNPVSRRTGQVDTLSILSMGSHSFHTIPLPSCAHCPCMPLLYYSCDALIVLCRTHCTHFVVSQSTKGVTAEAAQAQLQSIVSHIKAEGSTEEGEE